jgi:cyanophycinase
MQPTLMAIGGALDLSGPILARFYQRAGGEGASIVIFPTASSRVDAGSEVVEGLAGLGLAKPACILPVRSRLDAFDPANRALVEQAGGVYFCGGNQVRITATLGGTPLEATLMAAYHRGAVIAGSSAGAAVLSSVMLAYGKSGPSPRQGMAQLVPGLGFTDRVIFDQHFRQRDRLGRLIYAMSNNPRLIGVGVDENTAAELVGDRLSVFGRNAVTLVDGSGLLANDSAEIEGHGAIGAGPFMLHVLTQGYVFDLQKRRLEEIPCRLSEAR